jgi:glycosyltransferase involved in cell wall biosynthesis
MNVLSHPATSATENSGNTVIHGMWIGSTLSRLELLTICSFLRHGHEFNLWVYDAIETLLPAGVILRDANEVLPRGMIYRKRAVDLETGVGAGSVSGVSSDLFRYRVLHQHGGIWVDMDVTCLRPFTFAEPYVFRSHRVGCVGSIMKAPKGSRLMLRAYEETTAIANEETPWLEPLRILSRLVEEESLQRYVRDDIANPDMWAEAIRPLIEGYCEVPEEWVAIHWMNEVFRTLKADEGHYKGRRILNYTPDKDAPRPGSLLHELYRSFGLTDPWETYETTVEKRPSEVICLPPAPRAAHILVASLTRGGAERIVVETAQELARAGITTTVYVLAEVQLDYRVTAAPNLTYKILDGSRLAKLRSVAFEMARSGHDCIQTHLISADDLAVLWSFGIRTIPVIHNARAGWRDSPARYNSPMVPLVVAVADAVACQLSESGLERPVVTIRHEIQRRPVIAALGANRRATRRRYGIRDDVFLIGMVGQFKIQKAYTRAIRILAELRRHMNAKLMIIGSWDHDYGSGRTAYQETMKLAVELGVVADVILPGNLDSVEACYPAFDIYMSTSIFEGLSISLLEAIGHGCKIVASDAGGNREALPPDASLITDGDDIEAYVDACRQVAQLSRREVAPLPPHPDAVLRLWGALAPCLPQRPAGAVLFLTKNLNIGGPQRALVNLLRNMDAEQNWVIGVLGNIHEEHGAELADAQIPVLSAKGVCGISDQAEAVIEWLRRYRLGTICFWNVSAEVKILLTKLLLHEPVRLVDVSPGPMLFDEMHGAFSFQRRLAFTEQQYFERLDHFVALYDDGLPDDQIMAPEKKSVIPRGVQLPRPFVPLPHPDLLLPDGFDPKLAIGTCCRIVPDKRLPFLLEMMDILANELPGASLTILGGPDAGSTDYFDDVTRQAAARRNVRMLGPHYDVQPFLGQFRVFVMISQRQGCPNASLEAMAMGLPVVANPSGGTAEQVIEGVTGFLVDTPLEMARRVRQLLVDEPQRRRLGRTARDHALTNFSMTTMVSEYRHLFSDPASR